MSDLWNAVIAWPNLPISVLLSLAIIYWIGVILGGLDLDLFHLDFHGDADLDMDLDLDAGADMDGHGDLSHHGPGGLGSLMIFLNLDKIPLTIVFTILITFWWAGAILTYHFFFAGTPLFAWLMHIPLFLGSVILTKAVTYPMTLLHKALDGDKKPPLAMAVGQIGILDFDCSEESISQAVIQTGGAPLIVNTKSREGFIPKGSRVLLLEKNLEGDFYYVDKV